MNCILEDGHHKPLDIVNTVYYNYLMHRWTPEEIRELRSTLGLTQQAFGDLVGVTRIYVNYLEQGVRQPSKTLCILLDCIQSKKTETEKESDDHGKKQQCPTES